ncbi:hypothetical protein [Jidongwangia harbinensis]|uniref:hypothetical protein n=1 Tax=Jidongwangia harbinensis TaxID=2878561 RepID=UPI001CDA1C61|nr:hypothetical protein [Jidongwangia harbinensis]MCA2211946.1 hypothetical protein [Jidongwangia harbinensis]
MAMTKRDLPYPYDQDFREIVTRVKGKREQTRERLANSLKVASYLKAGTTLIERNLGSQEPAADSAAGERAGVSRPGDERALGERKPYWSGIRFLTERALIRETEMIAPPFLRLKGDGPYRSTWASHDDYITDLLAFVFHAMNYDPQYGAARETRGDWLTDDGSFADAVDRATYHELEAICRMPLFRLQLIMAATAHRNDGIHDAIANNYAGALEPWKRIYESTFKVWGFRLRTGVTMDQLADMLAAVTEGFAVRHLGDPQADVVAGGPPGNLVGMAVLGLLNSYLEPVDRPRGPSLRETFDAIAERSRHH